MGRKKKFDRDEAVETVMHELWREGYELCSVQALSNKLGITRSSFYNAFGSREELFLEAYQKYCESSPDLGLNQISADDQVLKRMCKVFKDACNVRCKDPEHRGCLVINSVMELASNHATLGPVLTQAMQHGVSRFEKLLKLAIANRELPKCDIAVTALSLQNLLIGLNVTCIVIHDEKALWASTKATLKGLGVYR